MKALEETRNADLPLDFEARNRRTTQAKIDLSAEMVSSVAMLNNGANSMVSSLAFNSRNFQIKTKFYFDLASAV